MANISEQFAEALKRHDVRFGLPRTRPGEITDTFLKEAYQINSYIYSLHSYLRSIRLGYLSTSLPPHRQRTSGNYNRQYFTDAQRDQIDAESKSTLRDINAQISRLEYNEGIRKDLETQLSLKKRSKNGFKALGRWAAGGTDLQPTLSPEEKLEVARQNSTNTHRESVIWFLRRKLEDVAELQRVMMETRLERELEKSKSVLYKARGGRDFVKDAGIAAMAKEKGHERNTSASGYSSQKGSSTDENNRREIDESLSPEQLQLFAQENNEMLKHYEDTLDQVRHAERSMIEISELQTTLAQNLEMQSSRIDQLVEDTANTEQNVAGGNKQLKKATEKWRPAKFVFYVSCGLSAFLIAWDLII